MRLRISMRSIGTLAGNTFERATPINLWNIDKKLEQVAPDRLRWQAITTGGFGGADVLLADAVAGTLSIDTGLVKASVPVADIGIEDCLLESGGGIRRRMRVFRLPEHNKGTRMTGRRTIALEPGCDNALYVCVTFEDGHLAWSSPIYFIA